jgi:transcriptional regulator with XRE-family HTH domain
MQTQTKLLTLKKAREAADLTQQELAVAARLSIATIRDLEQHIRVKVRDRTWHTLTRLLGVEGFADISRRSDDESAGGVG